MNSIKGNFSEYFKKSVLYLIKSKIVFFIFLSFECIEIATNITYDISVLFRYNQIYNYKYNKLSTIILTISPYHYFFNFMKNHISEDFKVNGIALLIIVLFYIIFFIYFLKPKKEEKEPENNNNEEYISLYRKIFINFFDYILYRALPLYSLDICTREIIMLSVKENYQAIDLILLFLSTAFLLIISFFHIIYYLEICIWSNFNVIDSCLKEYPYDQFFSAKFDIMCFFLKMLITFNLNYIIFHEDQIDFIAIFISFLIIISFLSFFIFTFFIIFFSDSVMYFHLSFYNKLRIFYILFIFECVLFRLILNTNEDHIPFIIYLIICFVLNCYIIIIGFDSLLLKRVIINQNYLGVCWFIQGNDIDIQHFIAEWITYHKTLCIYKHCLICREVGNKEKNYFGDYCLNENKMNTKNLISQAQNAAAKKKANVSKKLSSISSVNLINKIFPPYKFSQILLKMSERRKKFMDHDDLIRFDFLHIMVLFLSEVSIEFHLFNELSKLIWKYSENRNVYVSLLLVYDIIKKNNLDIIKGYDIIKKNEDLRNNLTEYIKIYENFIKYGDKSPSNYIQISGEFHKFKEVVKDIHILFKKNIECNYQLLLMRYAYESLLHLQFKNMQPFDLNYYSDFLDFHFSNDKIILMKYFIEYDYFLIIKGSKELLKFQGKLFSKIFPPLFENIAISKFKEQLTNQEQKDKKPLFEFFMKSMNLSQNLGFVESIKMKYFIYPTNSINELFIQANYVNNYNNLMIFEDNGKDEALVTFSPQMYKIIGLTPDMIASLKKTMNFITFNKIFHFKNNNENSHNRLSTINSYNNSNIFSNDYHHHNFLDFNQNKNEDNLCTFQYKAYYPYYLTLVSSLLRDNTNFSQVKEKVAEISNLAKEQKEISFMVFKKFELSLGNIKYIIYTLKEHKKRMKGEKSMNREHSDLKLGDLSGSHSEEYTNADEQDDSEFNDQFEGKGKNLVASTLSLASFSGSALSTNSSLQRGKKEVKNDEKNKRAEELKRYTIIILIFSLFLIMICILFLILGINQNENFQELFNLFDKFKRFKRGAESSSLSLVSNYKYYSKENPEGTNMYQNYSKNVENIDTIFKDVPIYKLIQTEIRMKYSKIMNDFYEYKKEMFILGSDVSEHISSISGYSYSLIEDNGLYFVKRKTDLIDLIRQYNNIIITFLQNSSYTTELFSLVNIGERINGSAHLYFHNENEIIDPNLKDMILLILIFPFIHEGLKQTSYLIEELFDNSLNTIENYLIIFYVILLLLHAVLYVICIIFLTSYIKMLKINIFSSNKLFNDKKFLDMQNKRIEQIKIMNNLYSEHPMKIAEKIDIIDELYRKKTKEENATNKTGNKTITSLENQGSIGDEASTAGDLKSKSSEDTLSKMQGQKKNEIVSDKTYLALDSIKVNKNIRPVKSFKDTNGKLNTGKNATNNNEQINTNNNFENIVNKNIKLSNKVFRTVINKECYTLYFTFGFYYLFNIILFILVYREKNKMNNLIDYCKINNSIDGYIFDNINSITYLYVTNSTSTFYSTLTNEDKEFDYVETGINTLYDLIQQKDSIEKKYNNIFPRLNQKINLNCSTSIINDSYFQKAFIEGFDKNEDDYQDYGRALCKLFPVASTGSDSNILLEILYNCEILYRKYKPNQDFDEIINLYVKDNKLFGLYTIILTLNRLIRTYFNDEIFIQEVNGIFDSFSYVFIIYLVLSVLLEIIIFFVLNFCVISDVRNTNKLLSDFMSSLKF